MFASGVLLLSLISLAKAQESYRVTGSPGYLILNSDDVTADHNEGNQTWVFGIGMSTRRLINERLVDFSADISFGQTRVFRKQNYLGTHYTDLRYQTVALSALRVFKLTDILEISAGMNLVPQYRTLIFDHDGFNLDNDRLLSFGAGLSGKMSLVELPSDNKDTRLVFSIAARWTNFFIHNARNRQIDGFRYNHVILSPQLSIQF